MRKATVGDVMTKGVIVARDTTSFKEMARLMAENGVRGLPVLDAQAWVGTVLGPGRF